MKTILKVNFYFFYFPFKFWRKLSPSHETSQSQFFFSLSLSEITYELLLSFFIRLYIIFFVYSLSHSHSLSLSLSLSPFSTTFAKWVLLSQNFLGTSTMLSRPLSASQPKLSQKASAVLAFSQASPNCVRIATYARKRIYDFFGYPWNWLKIQEKFSFT